jgi:hypothetical protein
MKTEYRVVWRREGMDRAKKKRVANLANAERLIGILTSSEPWRFLRDTRDKGPDDLYCCSGTAYSECACGGLTVREWCDEKRKDLPPIEYVRVEQRSVEPWVDSEFPKSN